MFNDISIDQRHAPFNVTYLQRMLRVIENATIESPRII